jgi:hypothetical protein
MNARQVVALLLALALIWLLVLFGPLLLAFAIARPDRERSHPFLLLLLGIAGLRWALRGCRETVQP